MEREVMCVVWQGLRVGLGERRGKLHRGRQRPGTHKLGKPGKGTPMLCWEGPGEPGKDLCVCPEATCSAEETLAGMYRKEFRVEPGFKEHNWILCQF